MSEREVWIVECRVKRIGAWRAFSLAADKKSAQRIVENNVGGVLQKHEYRATRYVPAEAK